MTLYWRYRQTAAQPQIIISATDFEFDPLFRPIFDKTIIIIEKLL